MDHDMKSYEIVFIMLAPHAGTKLIAPEVNFIQTYHFIYLLASYWGILLHITF